MRFPYILTETPTSKTLMVQLGETPHVVPGDHARFAAILEAVADDFDPAELAERADAITDLINFAEPALETMRQLSERVSYFGGTLLFDGDPVDSRLADHILDMLNQGDDNWSGPVRFMERLATNPAKHVRRRLFKWISDRGMTITPDGLLVGYKGTQDDEQNTSRTAGNNTVWVDGTAHTGHIPNPVGATVHMSRSAVDNDRDAGCSQGLHVGTFDYAQSFTTAPHVLVVEFDPRDVVAIPKEQDYSKIRVCRYKVLHTTEVKINRTTWTPDTDETDPFETLDDNDDVILCIGCGDETDNGEPQCENCLADEASTRAEDAAREEEEHSRPTVAMLDGDR